MNTKVPYRLATFAIIIEISIFEIVLMRARREKRSSRSRYSPAQFIKHWLPAARWRGKRGSTPLFGVRHRRSHSLHRVEEFASMVVTHKFLSLPLFRHFYSQKFIMIFIYLTFAVLLWV